ncbi:alpha-latrocrustotoxin-Lt1a-like [Xenia sp. Carnegie-2017]|uniref:alpha-latrocrustotoxin-Lt1a-like n=1 Tax=Xenia sp. Carnegie-2017 TaxID=2897299 RepID=UPI001F03A697|nr:alpha-latrocrustotoxin-Lt1a-like [Xenia sp. Carnegie-2017]
MELAKREETEMDILDTRRNQFTIRKKPFEEMLLREIPGTTRTNEPMHAVLESQLGDDEKLEGEQVVRNRALIHYLATLANSNNFEDKFDYDFVESLIINGADINSKDKSGQTVFHEVARSWNIDVARFLIKHGANVNQQDQYGRSPLHVAAAVDYADMVEFLLQNGARIDIKTTGEEQEAIHFAAKNDAISSLQMLLTYGGNIDARDSKNRTPLQVSAEMNRSKAAKLLIAKGAPAGVYDELGNSALSLLIEKIPEVALSALDQFHSVDMINRKELYFLNYLEGNKLRKKKTPARTPLEIAVQNERFDIVMHPVMQRLVGVKWQMYGKFGAVFDLTINLIYTTLWTVLAITLPINGRDLYLPLAQNSWRLIVGIFLFLFTILEIRKQVVNTIKSRHELKKWREWRADELERDMAYCHPRWPQEDNI